MAGGISCNQNGDYFVRGVSQPVISLNGEWKVCLKGFEQVQDQGTDSVKWRDVEVPGELMMQGIAVKHDKPFVYFRKIRIPSDYDGKLVKIRFEGVYSFARVWVNGIFIRDHSGGFTAWECDISRAVRPGREADLFVEVTDKADEISYASGYAKHPIGGILRNVSLLALPVTCPEKVSVSTDLDEDYKDAVLTIEGSANAKDEDNSVAIELFDLSGNKIALKQPEVKLTDKFFKISNQILNPLKWEAEHPNLYRLRIIFKSEGKSVWEKNYNVGFREIEVKGNKFMVNGRQVRLRGACHHDIHPLLGRLSTPDYDLKDVQLAKEANINFIRTSHYPPSDNFLSLCDRYGIYVEDETAVCFVGSHRTADYYPGSTENLPDFTGKYLSQLEEMVNSHRNHPSVIIWSIGNENVFGSNFKESYDWAKANDASRPVIYSYPGMVPDSIRSFDIISMHYPGLDGNMDQYGMKTKSFGHDNMPVLFDEWAHVACYNNATLSEDPNVRDFWGISLDSMWQHAFDSEGCLGGAIWGMVDETFMIPSGTPGYNGWWGKLDKNVIPGSFAGPTVGYGEWGIIDTWRRKKPEFWNVKKAYSPVRILSTQNYEFLPDKYSEIPVYNRFDFTNLNELNLKVRVNGRNMSINIPDIPPHRKGIIQVPLKEKPADGMIYLEFTDKKGDLIDSYVLSGKENSERNNYKQPVSQIKLIRESDKFVIACDSSLKFIIDRSTGLFSGIETSSGIKKFSGPFINLRMQGRSAEDSVLFNDGRKWKLLSLSADEDGGNVNLLVKGSCSDSADIEFGIMVSPGGMITARFTASNFTGGKVREAGIKYLLGNDFDSLIWKRIPYWSVYPENQLSGPEGNVPLFTDYNKSYRKRPEKEWPYDKKSFFYNGIRDERSDEVINIALSTKENILEYCLRFKDGNKLTVHGNGDISCRIRRYGDNLVLFMSEIVDYPDLAWGNYIRNILLKDRFKGEVKISLR